MKNNRRRRLRKIGGAPVEERFFPDQCGTCVVRVPSRSHPEKKRAAKVKAARREAFPPLFRTGGVLFRQGGVLFGKGGVMFRTAYNFLIFRIIQEAHRCRSVHREKSSLRSKRPEFLPPPRHCPLCRNRYSTWLSCRPSIFPHRLLRPVCKKRDSRSAPAGG